ncbi:MAG: hypothetical protein M1820_005640 [Bogoriella megaspora]|nr:MAG: hypothetical protein M1820_005640 [Bogoriella megaspora]
MAESPLYDPAGQHHGDHNSINHPYDSYDVTKSKSNPFAHPDPTLDAFGHSPNVILPARTASNHVPRSTSFRRNVLGRFGSLRTPRFGASGGYGALAGETENDKPITLTRSKIEEEDETMEEAINIDISGLEGSIQLDHLSPKKEALPTRSESINGLKAHTDRTGNFLGWERTQHSKLGSGMRGVYQANITESPSTEGQHLAAASRVARTPSRAAAQAAAQRTGAIVAVDGKLEEVQNYQPELKHCAEVPTVDLTNLGGTGYKKVSQSLDTIVGDRSESLEKSYYFPQDQDMPDWKPFSIHWAYIVSLILMALAGAAIQEWLCQRSQHLAKQGSGIISFGQIQNLSTGVYFLWKYMPVIVVVVYGFLWQISDFEVKRLEPFYQLSRRNGATAAESLSMNYLTFFPYFIPFKAFKYRQWTVFYSSTASLLAANLIPVLQSASVQLYAVKDGKVVRIVSVWSRLLSVFLIIVAICGVLLFFKLRRKSGLLSDPRGIAGIASMATKSHILHDFKGLDTSSVATIHKQLKNRRYLLHKSSLWQGEFIKENDSRSDKKFDDNPHPVMMRLAAGIPFIVCMVLFAASLPIFIFVPAATAATRKVPILLTLIATVIQLLWTDLDLNVRLLEPFYLLSKRHAPPKTLTLDYTGTPPVYLTFKAFINKHYLVGLTSLGGLLTQVLTVCVSSFGTSGWTVYKTSASDQSNNANIDNTFASFWGSFAMALVVLIYLCIIAALVYVRRRHKFLPREPATIASVLAFIHQSRMLLNFIGTETMDAHHMTKHLEAQNKTYGLGWFRGRDGDDHCGIDEEPLLSEYQHGVDWTKGRIKGDRIGTWETY